MINRLSIFFLSCFLAITHHSQADVVCGVVADMETREVLGDVMLTYTFADDNVSRSMSISSVMYTDSLGQFKFVSNNHGEIRAQLIGYYPKSVRYLAFSDSRNDTVTIDTIFLKQSEVMMKALEIRGRSKRFSVRGDTIVFHPEAFHLEQGTRLEELIAQLPGVEVKDDGLKWNGKPIRLTMNGESILDGSKSLGMLPVEAVEHIKAYNKVSEFSERTGKDDGSDDMVLDVKVKKSFLDKWYGNIEGQYCTLKHYGVDAVGNRLSDTNPALISASANNLSQQHRRGMSTKSFNNKSGFGQEQYGCAGYQHNWQRQAEGQTLKSRWFVNGGLAHDDHWKTSYRDVENFFPEEQTNYSTSSDYERTHSLNPSADAFVHWALNTKNSVSLSVKAEHNDHQERLEQKMAQFRGNPYGWYATPLVAAFDSTNATSLLLRNHNLHESNGTQDEINTQVSWTHYIPKGRLNLTSSFNNGKEQREKWTSRNIEYANDILQPFRLQQHATTRSNRLTSSSEAKASQWLGKKVLMNLSYRFMYGRRRHSCDFFTNELADAANSYDDRYDKKENTLRLSSTISLSKLQLIPQISWMAQREDEAYQRGDVDTTAMRCSKLFMPQLNAKLKLTRTSSIELIYKLNTTQPALLQTVAYTDNSDPLFVKQGNPSLRNSHTNCLSMNYNLVQVRHQLTLNIKAICSISDRSLQDILTYNPQTATYISRPENVHGERTAELHIRYDQALGHEFRLKNDFNLSLGRHYRYLTAITGETGHHLNRQNNMMPKETFTLSYDHEWMKCSIFATLQANCLRFSEASLQDATLWNNQFGGNVMCTHNSFTFNTQLTLHTRRGYVASGMNRTYLLWNAYAEYSFLKKKASLTLYLNDLLNQLDNFSAQQMTYQNIYSWSEMMHHYINITFTYHFDAKAKKS